jgi:hypothetical protein
MMGAPSIITKYLPGCLLPGLGLFATIISGNLMTNLEFQTIRSRLKKTQREMARLLGISLKAVESYEQGCRQIPANIERIVYFLLFKLHPRRIKKMEVCWIRKKCPSETRRNCVAWIAGEGFFCWFMTGKSCLRQKKLQGKKMENCFTCDFFQNNLKKIDFPTD